MEKPTVLLIGFYNTKALGLRYLDNALTRAGYAVKTLFFKDFNSLTPKKATKEEIGLALRLAAELQPLFIGFSVMTSLYLETVRQLAAELRANSRVPLVFGGVYATMFPEECLKFADYVIRGEGEAPVVELADALQSGADPSPIQNLAYRGAEGAVINPMRPLMENLDGYGVPKINAKDAYFIENGRQLCTDPQLSAMSYELAASRGCPFACTYCCSINLRRLSGGDVRFVRFRAVESVIEELRAAKRAMKKLVVVHFWDEVFSSDERWVDEFARRYKAEIGLPFEIWGHPLRTDEGTIRKLRAAGLYKVVMGIQSGSPGIRREVFRRAEKQEDILKASQTLAKCGVPQVIYDFMLRHPFETAETIRETFDLCMQLEPPFELQLHGLNFLPGTDIVQMALDQGLVSEEEMQKLMYAPMDEQYALYWRNERNNPEIDFWYNCIYLTQFKAYKKLLPGLTAEGATARNAAKVGALLARAKRREKLRYYGNKGTIVLRGTLKKRF